MVNWFPATTPISWHVRILGPGWWILIVFRWRPNEEVLSRLRCYSDLGPWVVSVSTIFFQIFSTTTWKNDPNLTKNKIQLGFEPPLWWCFFDAFVWDIDSCFRCRLAFWWMIAGGEMPGWHLDSNEGTWSPYCFWLPIRMSKKSPTVTGPSEPTPKKTWVSNSRIATYLMNGVRGEGSI